MDDLIDRLAEVRPRPSCDIDLAQVRQRVRQRRRRRHAAVGVLGAAVLLVGALGANRLVADGGERELEVVGPVTNPTPFDTVPFDTVPLGPEREVATGAMPAGGVWSFVAYETADGLCGEIETPDGTAGACFSAPPYDEALNVSFSDGRANSGLLFARAVVGPVVAMVRIGIAGQPPLELEPVDVGLPLDFVFTALPDDAVVTSVEALDAAGEVLDTADGYTGPPG